MTATTSSVSVQSNDSFMYVNARVVSIPLIMVVIVVLVWAQVVDPYGMIDRHVDPRCTSLRSNKLVSSC